MKSGDNLLMYKCRNYFYDDINDLQVISAESSGSHQVNLFQEIGDLQDFFLSRAH